MSIRNLQTMVSAIPCALGPRMQDPYVYVVFGAPAVTLNGASTDGVLGRAEPDELLTEDYL